MRISSDDEGGGELPAIPTDLFRKKNKTQTHGKTKPETIGDDHFTR